MSEYLWLIPLLPLAGAALCGLLGKRFSKPVITAVACGSSCAALVLSAASVLDLFALAPDQRRVYLSFFTWIASGDFVARVEFLLDPLSAIMLLVVTGVGFLIHIYSIGYMQAESGYYRFFSYMNLFLFSMLVLVLADNFLLLFVGWEGVGLCSYLLIGYYFERNSAADAGKKAFIVNRIGDVGFILGILLIFAVFGTLNFDEIFGQIASSPERFAPEAGIGVLTAIALLLFVGATGKSAQVPLYVWLPDAMEGPTPVSALIHAATMVTAGVYVVVRCAPIYSRAPFALEVITVIGLVTAIMAALIALVQTDIKRVLAYSTVSQLGYMFVAAGVGAFSAAIFHLMTHAFFKALLFLGAGSVIHALGGEQDLTRMGGLRRYLPATALTMMVATLAISGIFPLAGFFSKDEILWSAWAEGHRLVWLLALVTAGLTAFYMFRLLFLTFYGGERFPAETRHHLHESPPSMLAPLAVLGVLSAVGGFVGLPAWLGAESNQFFRFLEPSFAQVHGAEHPEFSHGMEALFAGFSIAAALTGIYVAYRLYMREAGASEAVADRAAGLYRLLRRKFYVDELYDLLLVRPTVRGSEELLWKGLEAGVIDGTVNGVGQTVQASAGFLKNMQNGLVRSYAMWILTGVVFILLYVSFFTG